jgi:hypothetical protein
MKDNKIIAEFMGFTQEKNIGWYDNNEVMSQIYGIQDNCFDELLFHDSWDWLMPVIEEIDHTSYEPIESIEDALATRCLNDTYKAVAEYVKEYHNEYHK